MLIRDPLTERLDTFGRPILQRCLGSLGEKTLTRRLQCLQGKCLFGRNPTRERDHLRPLSKFEDLPSQRGIKSLGSARKLDFVTAHLGGSPFSRVLRTHPGRSTPNPPRTLTTVNSKFFDW